MAHPASPCGPFAGLGHDLAPVAMRARAQAASYAGRARPAPPGTAPGPWPAPRAAWGYALLLGLSREIRGS